MIANANSPVARVATHSSIAALREAQVPPKFPPLEVVNRPRLSTGEAAYYLNRSQQTMRIWAMKDGTGPIRPMRVNGRLAWPTAEIKRLLGVK